MLLFFLAGLCFGSFLNVCISRIPRDESIVRPRSHCPHCSALIRWYDNLPLLSFVLLRRRCRDCGGLISYRYPAVELLTALVFVGCYAWFGLSWLTLKYCVFGFLLVGLIFMDAETGLLPHEFTYPGIALGLLFACIAPGDSSGTWLLLLLFGRHIANPHLLGLLDGFVGALFGAGFFYVAWAAYYLVRKRHGLGFGDIALMAMSGAFLGLKLTALVILCAPMVTLVFVLILIGGHVLQPRPKKEVLVAGEIASSPNAHAGLAGSDSAEQLPEPDDEPPFLQREIPFGVFLGACSLVAVFFGEKMWGWYLSKF